MVGGFNVGFVGVVSIGISALPRRYYESRCTHLRERVAPAVARLLRRTQPARAINCRLPPIAQLTPLARAKFVHRRDN